MSSIREHRVLYRGTAAGTGEWIRLDSRYEEGGDGRVLRIYKAHASDTLTLQAIVKDTKGTGREAMLAALDATKDISTLKTYTTSDTDILDGPWTHIRIVKTGANGDCLVEGFV